MAQFSYWWTTEDTTPIGHQVANYTQVHLAIIARVLTTTPGEQGISGMGDGLAFSNPSGLITRIATGGAVVDGKPIYNDSNLDLTHDSSPSYRRDRVILRCDWSGYILSLVIKKGTDGSETPPALTNTPGTLVEKSICEVRVSGSSITQQTDERTWAGAAVDGTTLESYQGILRIKDDGVSNAKLRNSAALSVIGRAVSSTGDPADIAAGADGHVLRRSGTALGFGTVATAGIGDLQVTETKLGAGAVTAGKLGAGAVTETKLGAGAVTAGKIATGGVTAGKIATGGVSAAAQIASGAVTETQLASGAVTAGKIATGGVSATAQLAAGVVTSGKLGAGSVIAGKIATGGVSAAAQLADGIVTSGKLGASSVIAGKIATGGVSAAAQLAAGIVDHTKAGAGIRRHRWHRGGSDYAWSEPGTNDYAVSTPPLVQTGVHTVIVPVGQVSAGIVIPFSAEFDYLPHITATPRITSLPTGQQGPTVCISSLQTFSFTATVTRGNPGDTSASYPCHVTWTAVGRS